MSGQIELSLVIPALDEARRLPPYLAAIRGYFQAQPPDALPYEVIVVDDGSRDGLAEVLAAAAGDWPQLLWIRHPQNRGKGAAVRTGVLASRGRCVLFADADGATPIDQEARLRQALADGADLAVGSRLQAAHGIRTSRSRLRGSIGRMFAGLTAGLLHLPVRDTQCGFKMFRGDAARALFLELQETGYLFDLELLLRARGRGLAIAEVPINWQEIPGGRFRPLRALPRVLGALWRLRRLKRAPSS